ncbi:MAG: hypothetical protein ACXVWW_02795 [Nocardioides sp.]
MAAQGDYDLRSEILQDLWRRVEAETYPSATSMDRIERLLLPDEVPAYAELLVQKIQSDPYPSVDLTNRVARLYEAYEDLMPS